MTNFFYEPPCEPPDYRRQYGMIECSDCLGDMENDYENHQFKCTQCECILKYYDYMDELYGS